MYLIKLFAYKFITPLSSIIKKPSRDMKPH